MRACRTTLRLPRLCGLYVVSPQGAEPPYGIAWWNDDTFTVCEVKSLTTTTKPPRL